MVKLDLKKEFRQFYLPSSRTVSVVDVPEFKFVMVDGRMQPGETPETSNAFQEAIGALYGLSYTLKFMSKGRAVDPVDYTVMALEGLWWTDSGQFDFSHPEEWSWRMMMMQPDHISEEMFLEALEQVSAKRDNPALQKARFAPFREGLAMQIMHIGPYADEPRTIDKMKAFAAENGYGLCGKHHEIYIGDPRRAKPENLKTVLRQPIERAA